MNVHQWAALPESVRAQARLGAAYERVLYQLVHRTGESAESIKQRLKQTTLNIHQLRNFWLANERWPLSDDLEQLLKFIRGEIVHWGTGITTYSDVDESPSKHQACLELERMGLIYRHFERDDAVVWKPVLESEVK